MDSKPTHDMVAAAHAEIHRLTAINAALLEALEAMIAEYNPKLRCEYGLQTDCSDTSAFEPCAPCAARAAIAQAKGETK